MDLLLGEPSSSFVDGSLRGGGPRRSRSPDNVSVHLLLPRTLPVPVGRLIRPLCYGGDPRRLQAARRCWNAPTTGEMMGN
jgi:hypothetical protein